MKPITFSVKFLLPHTTTTSVNQFAEARGANENTGDF